MTTQEIRNKKNALRKQYKKIRADISDKDVKSCQIAENLLASMSYKYAKTVLIYSAKTDEPDTVQIAEAALRDGKRVYFPKSYSDGIMKFFRVSLLSELTDGMFGIKEPDEKAEEYTPCGTAELCIVPGVCFDRNGYRIGYGKGYYDRFLSKFKGISAGLAFSECISNEPVPFEKRHDKQLNLIISEKGLELIGCK